MGDLLGKVVAFEDSHPTEGFLLPAGTLVDRGFQILVVSRARERVTPDDIGYFFTLDEENTFELTFRGEVSGGAVSKEDFLDFTHVDKKLKAQLMGVDHTVRVPLQFVSGRADLDADIMETIIDLLGHMSAKA